MNQVAIIHDALAVKGGAEKVLEAVCELFPNAPIYTLVYDEHLFKSSEIAKHPIHTSFIQKFPFSKSLYRNFLPLLPLAIENFNLNQYALVISLSYAVAHGVLTHPNQLHINYCFTPLRHAWYNYHQFLEQQRGVWRRLSPLLQQILSSIRRWDYVAAQRPDEILAVSEWVRQLIRKYYHRRSTVLYPPVNIPSPLPTHAREDFFLVVSRLVPHKHIGLIVQAFNQMKLPLKVVGAGAEYTSLKRSASPNIEFTGYQADEVVLDLMTKARAFIVAGTEDFNLAAVEAQACGCPIIAYGTGGVCETVIEGKTGVFFSRPTADALVEAVKKFIKIETQFSPTTIQENASRFSKASFQEKLLGFIHEKFGTFELLCP